MLHFVKYLLIAYVGERGCVKSRSTRFLAIAHLFRYHVTIRPRTAIENPSVSMYTSSIILFRFELIRSTIQEGGSFLTRTKIAGVTLFCHFPLHLHHHTA